MSESVSEELMYKCTVCDVMFSSLDRINSHVCGQQEDKVTEDNEFLYRCSACQGLFEDIDTFSNHVCGAIKQEPMMGTSLLDSIDAPCASEVTDEYVSMATEEFVDNHVNQLHQQETFLNIKSEPNTEETTALICDCCEKKVKSRKDRRSHLTRHRKILHCALCNRSVINHRMLAWHFKLMHPKLKMKKHKKTNAPANSLDAFGEENDMDNLGSILGHSKASAALRNINVACHRERRKHLAFTLATAKRNQKKGRILQCDEHGCNKTFKTKLGLEFHIRSHLGLHLTSIANRQQTCMKCGRSSWRKERLRDHKHQHYCQYKCHRCEMQFSSSYELLQHQTHRHRGMTRSCSSHCGMCHRTFHHYKVKVRHDKVKHRKTSRKIGSAQPSGELTYSYSQAELERALFYNCALCFEVFTTQSALQQHSMLHRQQNKLMVCPCLLSFSTLHACQEHIKLHHANIAGGDKKKKGRKPKVEKHTNGKENNTARFRCSECGLLFTSQPAFLLHLEKFHRKEKKTEGEGASSLDKVSRPQIKQEPGVKKSKSKSAVQPPPAPTPSVVYVQQEGDPIPITTAGDVSTRILHLEVPPTIGPWSAGKKQLHRGVFRLRAAIEAAVTETLRPLRSLTMPHAAHFQQILGVSGVQSAIDSLRESVFRCALTVSVPFPDIVHRYVYVNFLIRFGAPDEVMGE